MKRRQLSKLSELPDQFSLTKYASLPGLGLLEWLPLLEARFLRRYMLRYDHYREEVRVGADLLLENPLWPMERQTDPTGVPIAVEVSSHISDMTVEEFFGSRHYFNNPPSEGQLHEHVTAALELDEHLEWDRVSDLLGRPVWRAFRDEGVVEQDEFFVKVSLHGSDEKIVADFQRWLGQMRAELQQDLPKKRVQSDDLQYWCRFGVLPYLDLTLWAAANGCCFTNQLLGLALFPDEHEVALGERIRKVVAPLAESICREPFTDMLRVQAGELVADGKRALPRKWASVAIRLPTIDE